MSIGAILKNRCGNRSQKEFAEAIGITKSAWGMYERNERISRDEAKICIADYFGTPIQKIFFREHKKTEGR